MCPFKKGYLKKIQQEEQEDEEEEEEEEHAATMWWSYFMWGKFPPHRKWKMGEKLAVERVVVNARAGSLEYYDLGEMSVQKLSSIQW